MKVKQLMNNIMIYSLAAISIASAAMLIAISVAAQALSVKSLWLSLKFHSGHSGAFSAVAWIIIMSWRALAGIYSGFK